MKEQDFELNYESIYGKTNIIRREISRIHISICKVSVVKRTVVRKTRGVK